VEGRTHHKRLGVLVLSDVEEVFLPHRPPSITSPFTLESRYAVPRRTRRKRWLSFPAPSVGRPI
jgi:hypothetical protein